jgi:hypothetical protein
VYLEGEKCLKNEEPTVTNEELLVTNEEKPEENEYLQKDKINKLTN